MTMSNRVAYSILTVKGIKDDERVFEGIASTPTVDRVGDVVESMGAEFTLPIPLLLDHNKDNQVGHVVFAKPTKDGIPFRAVVKKIPEPGLVKDLTDMAWHLVKYGLRQFVSIGFKPIEGQVEQLKSGGLRFKKWAWLELSMVSIPAQPEAVINFLKSLDADLLAASGHRQHLLESTSAGASATKIPLPVVKAKEAKRTMTTKSISDQIKELEATRGAKAAAAAAVLQKSIDESRSTDATEQETFDDLESGVKAIDGDLKRLESLEKMQIVTAKPVARVDSESEGSARRAGIISVRGLDLPKGTLFTRYAMAVAAGKGSYSDTLAYAKRWDSQTPEVSNYVKAVAGTADGGDGSASTGTWGAELVYPTNLASEFVELLRPATIIGRIPGIRRVPFNVRITTQTGGSTVNWVGEAAAKPVSELDLGTIQLGYNKIAGIVVLSDELVRLSSPSAEETVRTDLINQIGQFMDAQFLDPTITATTTRPASITNGVSAVSASGTTADALYSDLNTALAAFDSAEMNDSSIVIVLPRALSRGISALRNALGQFEFPKMEPTGGSLMNYPVIVSNSVPSGTIVLISANDILMADDGRVMLDASNQATLDMAGGDTPAFSLWQKNCVGIRAERWITWAKKRATAVAMIETAAYGPSEVTA